MSDISEAFEIIDSWKISFGGPLHPVQDENGVVHLCDSKGVSKIMMGYSTYEELLEYKKQILEES